MCSVTDYPPYDLPSGQLVADEERPHGARASAPTGGPGEPAVLTRRRPGHLEELLLAEIRERWNDRAWYRRRRTIATGSARTLEYASDAAAAWDSIIADNARELRTLLRVLRKVRRR